MKESQLVDIEALIDKVEKLKQAEPYLHYVVKTKKQLIDIKKPIIDSVRQSIRHISHLVQNNRGPLKEVKRPEAIRKKTQDLGQPMEISPVSHSYKCAFREYKIGKEEHEQVKRLSQVQQDLYAQKIKQINDRINRIELQYDPIEWKHIPDEKLQFSDAKEMVSNYLTLFENQIKKKQKKVQFQKSTSNFVDEYEMRNRIFDDLSTQETGQYVTKDSLIKFLKEHPYFMTYFNIDPEMLQSQVRYFESKNKNTLHRRQFHIFLNQPRTVPHNITRVRQQQQYILQQEHQQVLHNIYKRLDTYGRNSVKRLKLTQYINHNQDKVSKTLLADVIHFPEVNRSYCLAKILRDFEYYEKYDTVTWDDFMSFLKNYKQSADRPTINIIQQKKVLRGQLSGQHLYLLGKEFVQLLIKCFNKCRRHNQYFICKSQFVSTMMGDPQYADYADSMTRMEDCKGIPKESVADTLQRIKQGQNYLDLDEIIECFSYRGRPSYLPTGIVKPEDINLSSDQSTESILRMVKSASTKKRKRYQNERRDMNLSYKNLRRMQITVPEEFNFSQNEQKTSIRNRRLQEMLKTKEELEEFELNFKFKSKPIPKSTYFVAVKTQQKQKSKSDDVNYLPLRFLVNPQFYKHRNPEDIKPHCQMPKEQSRVEKREPPSNIKDSRMLQKIQQKNEQRRYQIFEKARKMYESRPMSPNMQRLLEKKEQPPEQPIRKIIIKPTPIPDFKKLHKQIENSRSKNGNLTQTKKQVKSKQSSLIKSVSSPKDIQLIIQKMKEPIEVPITKKFESMVEKRKKGEKQQLMRAQFEERQNREKIRKRKQFAKYMFKNHSQTSTKKILEWQTQQKLNQYRRRQQRLAMETENEIAQIYKRVLSRPFLYEGDKQKTTIKKKTRHQLPTKAPTKNVRAAKPEQKPLLREVKEQEVKYPDKELSDLEEDQSEEMEPQKQFPGADPPNIQQPYAFFNEQDDESEPYYDEKNHSF